MMMFVSKRIGLILRAWRLVISLATILEGRFYLYGARHGRFGFRIMGGGIGLSSLCSTMGRLQFSLAAVCRLESIWRFDARLSSARASGTIEWGAKPEPCSDRKSVSGDCELGRPGSRAFTRRIW